MKNEKATVEGSAPDESPVDVPSGLEARRPRKKLAIILGVCAAVVVAAGAGFMAWHEQPSFCNAICHSPMDPYVEGYYESDATTMIGMHAATGAECLDCHEPTLSQQVSEGVKWVTGDFYDPLEPRGTAIANRELCFDCHDDGDPATGTDWEDIVASTADYNGDLTVNPHASHLGNDVECGDCHSMHGTSAMYCNDCHNMEAPEGWEA